MKQFDLALEIRTNLASLEKLEGLMGLHLSNSSHQAGDVIANGRTVDSTLGVYDIRTAEEYATDINALLMNFVSELKGVDFRAVRAMLPDVTFAASICVFFDTVNCSIELSPNHMSFLTDRNIDVKIVCYPTSFDT